jgi:hypothetical protein
MKTLIALSAFSFLVGFLAAYGFDTWLQYRDGRRWRS